MAPKERQPRTYLYYAPREVHEAQQYKAIHKHVLVRSTKGFDPNDMDAQPGDTVRCLDGAQIVCAAYDAIGIEVDVLGRRAAETPPEAPSEPTAPALPEGYEVTQAGTWHKLIGPDGQQVGKAQRSHEEAIAQLEA